MYFSYILLAENPNSPTTLSSRRQIVPQHICSRRIALTPHNTLQLQSQKPVTWSQDISSARIGRYAERLSRPRSRTPLQCATSNQMFLISSFRKEKANRSQQSSVNSTLSVVDPPPIPSSISIRLCETTTLDGDVGLALSNESHHWALLMRKLHMKSEAVASSR